jgi:hypothetical protein
MWTQLQHHDYYMVPMYPVLLFGLIMAVHVIRQIPGKCSTIILATSLIVTTAFQFYDSKTHVRTCFKKDNWKYSPVHFDQFFEVEPMLRNCGIKLDDKVISVFDHTPDVSLYLMNQKGVTVSYHNFEAQVDQYLKTGAFQYLIYNKASDYDGAVFLPEKFPLKLVYSLGYISIYHITSDTKTHFTNTPAYLSPWN